ncbi:hypothetical protein ABS71_02625 [bacterium SCN 62-11]|nr:hypothetical protein [Candidatus Eremiobacteraeota bacterium]ODT77277.1 MAG: hypothetical protein ABS71_02625 [bacterium SCN 62-11]
MRYFLLFVMLLALPGFTAEVPDHVVLGGKTLRLQVFAWRDFMPQIGGDGSGSALMVTPSLVDDASRPLEGVVFSEIVASFQQQDWKAGVDPGGTARGGPKWPTGKNQLLVRAHYSYKGSDGWIRLARPTGIGRTE